MNRRSVLAGLAALALSPKDLEAKKRVRPTWSRETVTLRVLDQELYELAAEAGSLWDVGGRVPMFQVEPDPGGSRKARPGEVVVYRDDRIPGTGQSEVDVVGDRIVSGHVRMAPGSGQQTMTHEVGHTLGLPHSNCMNAIMFAFEAVAPPVPSGLDLQALARLYEMKGPGTDERCEPFAPKSKKGRRDGGRN